MALTVTVLGCSGTYAAPGNVCSGYLVRGGGVNILMDAGPGTLANLQQHLPLTELDAVVVSHSHPDHWLELPVLRNALRYIHGVDDLGVFSTVETLGLLEVLCHGQLAPTMRPTVISDGSQFHVGGLRVRCSRTDHPPETLALRVDDGDSSVGYSADTGPGWSLSELGPALDLAICEATFLERHKMQDAVHLTAAQAGRMGRDAQVKRLVLTHVLPTEVVHEAVGEAADAYGAPVEAAETHHTFQV